VISKDSSVGIETGYGLDGGGKVFLFIMASRRALGPTHLSIQWATEG
jgi:hypothetical protein